MIDVGSARETDDRSLDSNTLARSGRMSSAGAKVKSLLQKVRCFGVENGLRSIPNLYMSSQTAGPSSAARVSRYLSG
jgi:hypothetical protein